jgi:3-deoxy-7-phosphoheptulonate synthase
MSNGYTIRHNTHHNLSKPTKYTIISLMIHKQPTPLNIIAGPCSVESEQQIVDIAIAVKQAGATALRGGAFKPRTSPYTWAGLGELGIKYLIQAKRCTGLPIVSEILSVRHMDIFQDVDTIQVGARSMQNFELLRELGKTDKHILLKRGFGNTVHEWLSSAEYIKSMGNHNITLCERGIRTFETSSRFMLDIAAIPVAQSQGYGVCADPSHAAGRADLVSPLALAAVAAGADGLLVECHTQPQLSLVDKDQSINIDQLATLIQQAKAIHNAQLLTT